MTAPTLDFLEIVAIGSAALLLFGTGAWAIYHVWPEFWGWLFPVDDEAAETDARDELHCLDEPAALPDWSEIERFLAMHERANIAKRRREKFGRQQMEHIWDDTTGGAA